MTAEQSTFMIDLHQVGMMLRHVKMGRVIYVTSFFLVDAFIDVITLMVIIVIIIIIIIFHTVAFTLIIIITCTA